MNPATLHFSKGWSLVQLAFMVGMGALALWLMVAMAEPVERPKLPAQSADLRLGQAPASGPYTYVLAPAPRSNRFGGPISAMILIACLPLLLWEVSIRLWRLFTAEPALALSSGQLVPHASFIGAPDSIPVTAIRNMIFDRADRVRANGIVAALSSSSLSSRWGRKAGARFRHTLLIDYVTEAGLPKSLRIGDADVEGGAEQLKQFAAYLKVLPRLA